ncbi:hypothetical protein [Arcticibacterium luteifluviistationis]|nr:hypothetical protein [Arcticibacterium luteifluviistationis]
MFEILDFISRYSSILFGISFLVSFCYALAIISENPSENREFVTFFERSGYFRGSRISFATTFFLFFPMLLSSSLNHILVKKELKTRLSSSINPIILVNGKSELNEKLLVDLKNLKRDKASIKEHSNFELNLKIVENHDTISLKLSRYLRDSTLYGVYYGKTSEYSKMWNIRTIALNKYQPKPPPEPELHISPETQWLLKALRPEK